MRPRSQLAIIFVFESYRAQEIRVCHIVEINYFGIAPCSSIFLAFANCLHALSRSISLHLSLLFGMILQVIAVVVQPANFQIVRKHEVWR